MDGNDWDALIGSLEPRELDVLSLPRFQLEYDTFLNGPLTDMGMGIAFTQQADFSDLSQEPLCIDFVCQKTFIEVDEAGTRAAAVTAVGIGPTSFIGLIRGSSLPLCHPRASVRHHLVHWSDWRSDGRGLRTGGASRTVPVPVVRGDSEASRIASAARAGPHR